MIYNRIKTIKEVKKHIIGWKKPDFAKNKSMGNVYAIYWARGCSFIS